MSGYTPTVDDAVFELRENATTPYSAMTLEGFEAALALVKAEAVAPILALHKRGWTGFHDDGERFPVDGCAHCKSATWPCATVRATSANVHHSEDR